jgi:L-ascorbate metabolism protein UlaG (beta-lactamase superfamily)
VTPTYCWYRAGGYCTINATQAAGIVSQVEPRIIVPMHYARTETTGHVQLDDVARFCRGWAQVRSRRAID